MPLKKTPILIILALVAITVLLYLNSLGNGFAFDDELLINDQAYVLKDINNVFSSAGSLVFQDKTSASFYRPILVLSYFIDYYLGGGGAIAFHLSNVMIHILIVLLVFYAAFLLFKDILPAFLAALFFSVHPAQAEAVAWISGRNDPLMMIFVLLSFICLVRYRENGGRIMLGASGLFFFLSLFTKESALIFPLVFLGYDLFINAKIGSDEKVFQKREVPKPHTKVWGIYEEIIPQTSVWGALFPLFQQSQVNKRSLKLDLFKPYLLFGALMIIYTFIRLFVVKGVGGQLNGLVSMPLTYLFYFKTLILPAGFSVVPFIKTQLGAFEYFIRSLPLLILLYLIVLARKRMPIISFGLWWALLALLPVSGIISMPVLVMEHRLYGAMFGFSLVFATISGYILKRYNQYRSGIIIVLMVILGLFAWMTFQRSRLFSSPLVLWETSAKNNPASDLIYTNLAAAQINLRNYAAAEEKLKKALEIRANNEIAHYNLGYLYLLTGRKKMAKEEFGKVVGLDPKYIKAHYNLGIIALNSRDYKAAISKMELILKLKPNFAPACNTMGDAYYNMREDSKAGAAYKQVLKFDPDNSHAKEILRRLNLE